jgi:septal ring factor EnvC (AmiA/AmiB activator)
LAGSVILFSSLGAQQTPDARLRAQREELTRIRQERAELERRMNEIKSNVHDLSEEVSNIDRQADITARAVRALDAQLSSITAEVDTATADLVHAQDELVVKRAILERRLIDIYKRGPLYSFEALLSAQTFGELVARYKYLRLLALRDQTLVRRMEDLRNQIGKQRELLVRLQSGLALNRTEKAEEEQRLRRLEEQREQSLRQAKRTAKQTEARLAQISRDEARLTDLISALEKARLEAARAAPRNSPPPAGSTLRTSDFGKLNWPVDGTIIYRFGRVVNPNNTTVKWNGIGISAARGTPVKSIAAGQVVVAEPFATYGLTVIIQHGGGDYSVYSSLASIDVTKGSAVTRGQVVGSVGTNDPELEPHLHFEIRPRGRAVDPLTWLQDR